MKSSRIQNQSYLRKINQVSIISALRQEKMSCSSLAKKTGLSNTAIANITDELVKSGLVTRENSQAKDVGRRPILMDINPHAAIIAAVELAGKDVYTVAADLHGNILAEEKSVYSGKLTAQDLHSICQKLKSLIKKINIPAPLTALCISSPGKVHPDTGYFLQAHRFEDCRNINLRQLFSGHFDCNIKIYNDIKLALSGEQTYGTALSGVKNAMLLHIDHSVGSALLLGGQVLHGTNGFAGEIVNYTVNASASERDFMLPKSRANVKNLSMDSLLAAVTEAYRSGEPTLISTLCAADGCIDINVICSAYNLCDPLTQNIMHGFTAAWSAIIKNIAELLDLETVLLSGAVTKLGDKFKQALHRAINSDLQFSTVNIEFSGLHTQAVIKGAIDAAANTAIKKLLENT